MPHYFYLLDAVFLLEGILPTLAACQKQRSFAPLHAVLPRLRIAAGEYSILEQAAAGMPFDRHVFQTVVGQVLLFGAAELPRVPLEPDMLATVVNGRVAVESERHKLPPIQQAFSGSRDLIVAGKPFRPFHVGWNQRADVARLTSYLETLDPAAWSDSLKDVPSLPTAEERAEEIGLLRDWWPEVVTLYRRAEANGWVVICEEA